MKQRFLHLSVVFLALGAQSMAAPWPALPSSAPAPADNPPTADKIRLGKKLFFDARLSFDGSVSCNSCHSVASGGTDNRSFSVGIGGQRGGRSAPTVLNAAFQSAQFWDGRANSLEDQAKGPLLNPVEMGMPSHAEVMKRISQIPGYVKEFNQAFPGPDAVTIDNLAKAIASYERTLLTPNSAYDRFANGDRMAMNQQQERGMNLMVSLGCVGCHSGAAFSGPSRPDGNGNYETFPVYEASPFVAKYHLADDKGRGATTGKSADDGVWRIPTLRNIALTAPYFHNGSVKSLSEAVQVMASTQLDITLTDTQTADIVAFLTALTGELPEQTVPILPPTLGDTLIPLGK